MVARADCWVRTESSPLSWRRRSDDYMEEDLKYMLDIAEREAINRFTTAEIKVEQHNENHIDGDTDLDGIMDAWATDFAEKLDISEEGVN